eukprot:TRINITY_DN2658_c0_g1_i1.p1 TRINITY_DN2658_c0_g1~~TRINITY_DN2658_c0_g1_i1.p1  ORF type:complete len:1279 (+),score=236.45 TRINITY_DN2658_c0_g1_i1:1311-5147(+)
MHVPKEEQRGKTISDNALFLYSGILFKLCVDDQSICGSDEHAMKADLHERKSLMLVHTIARKLIDTSIDIGDYDETNPDGTIKLPVPEAPEPVVVSPRGAKGASPEVPRSPKASEQKAPKEDNSRLLHVPMMAVVDYLGYRVIAVARIRMSQRTLVYARASGKTLIATDKTVNAIVHHLAEEVNLADVSLQGHLLRDGTRYLVDVARMLPPEDHLYTNPVIDAGKKTLAPLKNPWHYYLLRPELIRGLSLPLSPDYKLSSDTAQCKQNSRVREATRKLHEMVIPRFASWLSKEFDEGARTTGADLVTALHRVGINLRHLGSVYYHLKGNLDSRVAVLTEMLARVFKNGIRTKMRKAAGVRPCKEILCSYLASIFGVNSNEFWRGEGLTLLKGKYPFPINRVVDDMESISREELFERLKAILGFNIISKNQKFDFNCFHVVPDEIELDIISKQLNYFSLDSAQVNILQAKEGEKQMKAGATPAIFPMQLYFSATNQYRAAREMDTNNPGITFQYASCWLNGALFAQMIGDTEKFKSWLTQSFRQFEIAASFDAYSAEIYVMWARALLQQSNYMFNNKMIESGQISLYNALHKLQCALTVKRDDEVALKELQREISQLSNSLPSNASALQLAFYQTKLMYDKIYLPRYVEELDANQLESIMKLIPQLPEGSYLASSLMFLLCELAHITAETKDQKRIESILTGALKSSFINYLVNKLLLRDIKQHRAYNIIIEDWQSLALLNFFSGTTIGAETIEGLGGIFAVVSTTEEVNNVVHMIQHLASFVANMYFNRPESRQKLVKSGLLKKLAIAIENPKASLRDCVVSSLVKIGGDKEGFEYLQKARLFARIEKILHFTMNTSHATTVLRLLAELTGSGSEEVNTAICSLLVENNIFEHIARFLTYKKKEECLVAALRVIAHCCIVEQAIEAILVLKLIPAIMLLVHPLHKKPPPTTQQLMLLKLSKTPQVSAYDAALTALTEIANNSAAATAIVNVDVPEGPTILLTVCNSYLSQTRDHIERKEESLWVLLSAIKALVRRTVRGVLDAAQVQELFSSLERLKDKPFSSKTSNLIREMLQLNEEKEQKPFTAMPSSTNLFNTNTKLAKPAPSIIASPRETIAPSKVASPLLSPVTSPGLSPSSSPKQLSPRLIATGNNDQTSTSTAITLPDIISPRLQQSSQQQDNTSTSSSTTATPTLGEATTSQPASPRKVCPPPENLMPNRSSGEVKGKEEDVVQPSHAQTQPSSGLESHPQPQPSPQQQQQPQPQPQQPLSSSPSSGDSS